MNEASFLSTAELEAGLDTIRQSPRASGPVLMVVRRPKVNVREVLAEGQLDTVVGLLGDHWAGVRRRDATSRDTATQLTLMNARAIELIAGSKERWPLAGDQVYVDLDLSLENLPPGTRVSLGTAVIEISAEPHTGCRKFVSPFGSDAMRFVNSPLGRQLNLRGVNARILQNGTVRVGDLASVLARIPS